MSRTKKAFTLIETLLAIVVVGIIASLTVPGLIKTTDKKATAAELARSVELAHTGIANVMHQVGKHNSTSADRLSDIKVSDVFGDISSSGLEDKYLTDGQTIYTAMRGPMGITEVDNSYLSAVKTYSGDAISGNYANFSSNKVYQFIKRHSVIIAEDINDSNVSSGNVGGEKVIARMFFDVNGSKKPNTLGKDIFLFGLTNSGQLVPAGSAAYNDNVLSETIPLYTAACDSGVTDARSCSARIMHDKWVIKY